MFFRNMLGGFPLSVAFRADTYDLRLLRDKSRAILQVPVRFLRATSKVPFAHAAVRMLSSARSFQCSIRDWLGLSQQTFSVICRRVLTYLPACLRPIDCV